MPAFTRNLISGVDFVSAKCALLSAWMFFAIGLFVAFEVFMRYVLTMPTVWVDELSRIFQVWATYLAISYILKERRHIVIDLAWSTPGSLGQKLTDTFAFFVIISFAAIVVKFGWDLWLKSTLAGHTTDSYLAIPKVYIQSSIWFGFGLLAVQSLAELAKIWLLKEEITETTGGHF